MRTVNCVRLCCAAVVMAAVSCAMRGPVKAQSGPTPANEQGVRTAELFEFHSSVFVNLHQTLLHEALWRKGGPDRRLQSDAPLANAGMSEVERRGWDAAVDFYAATFHGNRELLDDQLVKINDALAREADGSLSLDAAVLPADVAEVLRSALPIYFKYWWRAHDAANRTWIDSMTPLVSSMGAQIAAAMQRDLKEHWPTAPVRVDVCYFVPEIGHAFTTEHPAHTTYSSSTPALIGFNGFETLFHEASHAFADTMTNALFSECAAVKKDCGDLWHGVLFFTAGEETRRALPAADRANFMPYAYKNGLYERGDYPKYRKVLEKDWQAYLDSKIDFVAAIKSMVADL